MVYYTFTTLSSVGFGDYSPQNTVERVQITFLFLFVLTGFALILGTMQDLLQSQEEILADSGSPADLQMFFGVLSHFNNDDISP